MLMTIKKMLGEVAGVDYRTITGDVHMQEDLDLDENDVDDLLNELEDLYGVEFEDRNRELVYVSDLIAYAKEVI